VQPTVPDPSTRGAWATPGAAAPQPIPTGTVTVSSSDGTSTGALTPAGVAAEPLPPSRASSPLRRLRPRGVGEILDGGFDVLRHRPGVILAMTAIVILPLYALPTLVNYGRISTLAEGVSDPQTPLGALFGTANGGSTSLTWLAFGGSLLANAFVGLGVGVLVSSWLMGGDPSLPTVLKVMLRRAPVLLFASFFALLIKGSGLILCGIGIVFPIALLMVLSPVIAAEPVGIRRSISRSWTLSSRRTMPMVWLVVLGGFVTLVVQLILQLIGGLVLSIWQSASWVWIAIGVVEVLIEVMLIPLRASWAALAYVDLRVRTEGLDIELESNELFAPSGRSPS